MLNDDALDAILDKCLQDIAAGRSSIEDCLRRYPQAADRLEPLLQIAARVQTVPRPPTLSPEKRRAIEQQLLNRAVHARPPFAEPKPQSRRSLRWRFSLSLAIVLVLVLGAAGTVTASTASLPGETLYPVKRVAEQVSLSFASNFDQAALHVEFAQRRIDEFNALSIHDDIRPELMSEASQEIALAMQATAALPNEEQQVMLEAVIRVADAHLAVSADTATGIAPAVRSALASSATTMSTARQRAFELLDRTPPPVKVIDATATLTDTPTLADASSTPTSVNPTLAPTEIPPTNGALPVVKPTDKPTNTPKPPNTPPGQVKTPNTPPGQVKTPKPPNTPPGQVKTPKPTKPPKK